jgi:diguanylate cyclase (GGDEF)-like protein/PAS domain S-box-containing protein
MPAQEKDMIEERAHVHDLSDDLARPRRVRKREQVTTMSLHANHSDLPSFKFFASEVLDSLTAHIAVLDADGTIVAVNRAWRTFAEENPPISSNFAEGANYLSICDHATGDCSEEAFAVAKAIRAVLAGTQMEAAIEYPCHSPDEDRWFIGRITRLQSVSPAYAIVSHENITARKQAEEAERIQHDLATAIGVTTNRTEALRAIEQTLLHVCGIDGIGIHLIDRRSGQPYLALSQQMPPHLVKHLAGQHGMPAELQDVLYNGAVWFDASTHSFAREVRTGVMVAANHQGQVAAVLTLLSRTRKVLPYSVRLALDGIAAQIGSTLLRLEAQEALLESEARLRLVAEHVDEVFWLTSPDEAEILYVSPAYETIFGSSCASLYQNPAAIHEAIHPDDRDRINPAPERTMTYEIDTEYRIVRPDGTTRWLWVHNRPVYNEQGSVISRVGVAKDITERKLHEAEIEHMAFTDSLTGLANRHHLYHTGNAALAAAQEQQGSVGLIYLDLNRFKAVNDTLGHDAGDDLLVQVAARMRSCVRSEDVLARLGGDEFAVLIPHADSNQAVTVARRILDNLRQPVDLRDQLIYLDGSIGIAVSASEPLPFSTLLTQADIAMYRAKSSGGGVQVYDPELSPILRDQLQLETELRQAIATEGLMLHYQPILDLTRNEMVGVEALVRWPHPTRGMLLPGSFLMLAEEAGLLEALDYWVLQTGLCQAAIWDAAQQPLDVSLNLSAQSLQNPSLVETMSDLLRDSGAPAERIIIEITEHTALSDMATTQQVLAGLRSLGLRIALDDFGSGYASLTSLQQLPVDVLKVDRMFTAGVGQERRDESVVQAMLTLGRGLNLSVVVEGVEQPAQCTWLREVSCPLVQGFLIGRPTSAASISPLYEQMNRREWQMGLDATPASV